MSQLHIIVASQNPVKISAVEKAFEVAFPSVSLKVEGKKIPSEVSDQPYGDEETYEGAFNRASGAKKRVPEADFWVGVEGGIGRNQDQIEAFAWMVIIGSHGQKGQARTASFQLPPAVIELLTQGYELGDANDRVFGQLHSKQKGGAVGLLTEGRIDRASLYAHALLLALIPFMQPSLFEK